MQERAVSQALRHEHAGQIVSGLDEGIKGMKTGGLRRIYVPGNLAFPKGLASQPGVPKIPPSSPVIFDVELVYCPGAAGTASHLLAPSPDMYLNHGAAGLDDE